MRLRERQQRLIDALKSGEFSQCIGRLHHNDRYCVMGVACKVYEDLTGKQLLRNSKGFIRGSDLKSHPEVIAFYEFHRGHKPYMALLRSNDCGTPFDRIAKMLESGDYWGKEM